MANVKELKALCRETTTKKLNEIPVEERKRQSDIVAKKIFEHPAYKNAKNVSIYLSLDTEINTEPILRKIFDDGKKCFVPRYKKSLMEMVELYSMEDWATLPVTKWNIKQPALKDDRLNALNTGLDLIIVPGVAFTKNGDRLGHGAGYYDKYLNNISNHQKTKPTLIAPIFREQLVDELPTEETDHTIDFVLYAEE